MPPRLYLCDALNTAACPGMAPTNCKVLRAVLAVFTSEPLLEWAREAWQLSLRQMTADRRRGRHEAGEAREREERVLAGKVRF